MNDRQLVGMVRSAQPEHTVLAFVLIVDRGIEFDDYITTKTVQDTLRILDDLSHQAELCNFNYALALRHFSYKVLRSKFQVLLANAFGTNGQ